MDREMILDAIEGAVEKLPWEEASYELLEEYGKFLPASRIEDLLIKERDVPKELVELNAFDIDWSTVYENITITNEFVEKYRDVMDFDVEEFYANVPEEVLENNLDDINWDEFLQAVINELIDIDFVKRIKEDIPEDIIESLEEEFEDFDEEEEKEEEEE